MPDLCGALGKSGARSCGAKLRDDFALKFNNLWGLGLDSMLPSPSYTRPDARDLPQGRHPLDH